MDRRGDMFLTDAQLGAAYQEYLAPWVNHKAEKSTLLAFNAGIDQVWSPPRALTLTPITELQPEWASPANPGGIERELVVSVSSATQDDTMHITGRHELGHVLGFPMSMTGSTSKNLRNAHR